MKVEERSERNYIDRGRKKDKFSAVKGRRQCPPVFLVKED
jgi:hypothetical protein